MKRFTKIMALASLAVAFCMTPLAAGTAGAANILFVSDTVLDAVNIPAVLTGEGHTVSVVTNDFAGGNPTLAAPLGAYDAVYWNASGAGSGTEHTIAGVFTNLTNYVSAGGCVYVTGYDSIASPDDPNLVAFIGAGDDYDDSEGPIYNPVINVDNSLTNGVVDIKGVVPTGGYSDKDCALSLGPDTVGVVESQTQAQCYGWTLRTLGSGQVAYVSNGAYLGNGNDGPNDHTSWTDTSAGGAGAYNASLRNFALVCTGGAPATAVPTTNEWGLIVFMVLAGLGAAYYLPGRSEA